MISSEPKNILIALFLILSSLSVNCASNDDDDDAKSPTDDTISDDDSAASDDSADDSAPSDDTLPLDDDTAPIEDGLLLVSQKNDTSAVMSFLSPPPFGVWYQISIPSPEVGGSISVSGTSRFLKIQDTFYYALNQTVLTTSLFDPTYESNKSYGFMLISFEHGEWAVVEDRSGVELMGTVQTMTAVSPDIIALDLFSFHSEGDYSGFKVDMEISQSNYSLVDHAMTTEWTRSGTAIYGVPGNYYLIQDAASKDGAVSVLYVSADSADFTITEYLLHWDGSAWIEMTLPTIPALAAFIWSVGPDDDWLAPDPNADPVFLHRNGSSFIEKTLPAPCDVNLKAAGKTDDGAPIILFPGIGYATLDDTGSWICNQETEIPVEAESIVGAPSTDRFYFTTDGELLVYDSGSVHSLTLPDGVIVADVKQVAEID